MGVPLTSPPSSSSQIVTLEPQHFPVILELSGTQSPLSTRLVPLEPETAIQPVSRAAGPMRFFFGPILDDSRRGGISSITDRAMPHMNDSQRRGTKKTSAVATTLTRTPGSYLLTGVSFEQKLEGCARPWTPRTYSRTRTPVLVKSRLTNRVWL